MVSMGRIDVIVNICRLDESTSAKGQGYRRKRPGRSLSRMPERLRLFLGAWRRLASMRGYRRAAGVACYGGEAFDFPPRRFFRHFAGALRSNPVEEPAWAHPTDAATRSSA
jgi:hypothetical protein